LRLFLLLVVCLYSVQLEEFEGVYGLRFGSWSSFIHLLVGGDWGWLRDLAIKKEVTMNTNTVFVILKNVPLIPW
jgi:hypothetical protein